MDIIESGGILGGKIIIYTTDYNGEGTDDMSIEIDRSDCSSYIHLNEDKVRELRDHLNDWLDDII